MVRHVPTVRLGSSYLVVLLVVLLLPPRRNAVQPRHQHHRHPNQVVKVATRRRTQKMMASPVPNVHCQPTIYSTDTNVSRSSSHMPPVKIPMMILPISLHLYQVSNVIQVWPPRLMPIMSRIYAARRYVPYSNITWHPMRNVIDYIVRVTGTCHLLK